MMKLILAFSLVLFVLGAETKAGQCPGFYRFVDFGIKDRQGKLHRGGSLFRAEGFDGQGLLEFEQTECVDVQRIAADGHGNPIPVVASVSYSPRQTGLELTKLVLRSAEDARGLADAMASKHRSALESGNGTAAKGDDFLCRIGEDRKQASCQLVSPYSATDTLVVYCAEQTCQIEAMAITDDLFVKASWPVTIKQTGTPEELGRIATHKARQIHDFLEPISQTVQ